VGNMKGKFQLSTLEKQGARRATSERHMKTAKAKRGLSLAAMTQRYMDLLRLREKISEMEAWRSQ
jgi:hypothetical protein